MMCNGTLFKLENEKATPGRTRANGSSGDAQSAWARRV